MTAIDRARLAAALGVEKKRFVESHSRSRALFEEAKAHLFGGVPMNWMARWAGDFPVFVEGGEGVRFRDVDGNEYLDLCLGDTGAMTGHAPAGAVEAIGRRLRQGVTFMLPTEDAIWVGKELGRRVGLPYWQAALTATMWRSA